MLADAGCTTGFGRVAHAIGDRLVTDYGHDIHCLATNYDGDYWPTPMKLYVPNKNRREDIYGQSRYVEMISEIMPDVVIMLNDPYVILKFLLRNKFDEELVLARARPIIGYIPIDGTNQPPAWKNIPALIERLEPIPECPPPRFVPVAMTEYGAREFGIDDLVYHGVDTQEFHPVSSSSPMTSSTGQVITSKKEAKRFLQLPEDSFLVLRVDRNSHRKNYGDTWRALVPVMEKHKNVHAWLHCKTEGDQLELGQLISRDMGTAYQFHYPGQFNTRRGWANEDLAILYAAADVFVSTSWGEGFGLTLVEAAASGLPIIAQNVSSIPEVVGPGGILIEPERLTATESGQDQWLPNVKAFSDAIERLYMSAGARRDLGAKARAHVSGKFSWDTAAKQFDEIITRTIQETPAVAGGDQ